MKALLLLCVQVFAPVQESTGFADALMRQRDYFRAITEYKRTLYQATDESAKNYCLAQIAKAYRKSSKVESAIEYAAELLVRANVAPSLRYRANLTIGLSYLESNVPQLSLTYFEAAREFQDSVQFPLLCLGLAQLELRNSEKAATYFDDAAKMQQDGALKERYGDFAAKVRALAQQPQKSPTLAGLFSAVIPGAGQYYSDHTYDAFQAFFYTASMAFGTYAMYRYEHEVKGQLLWTYVGVSITGIFHAANIIGAYRTAEYRNWKQQSDFAKELYDAVMAFEPS